jgi:hypothetical protein
MNYIYTKRLRADNLNPKKKEYTLLDFMKIERFRYSHINMKKKKICTLGLYEDLINCLYYQQSLSNRYNI